jgi:hypothetical protein
MKMFYSPAEIMRAGKAALKARCDFQFRKTIEHEAKKPHADFKGGQLPLEELCVVSPEAVLRHSATTLTLLDTLALKQDALRRVAEDTKRRMWDEFKFASRDKTLTKEHIERLANASRTVDLLEQARPMLEQAA